MPQGSVISPILFSWYIADFPKPPKDVMLIMYADDITIVSQDTNIETAEKRINEYLETIEPYLKEKQLIISIDKCHNMLFSTWKKEWKRKLNISLNNIPIETKDKLKLLGVTLDHALTFHEHIKDDNDKCIKSNNAIKSITHPNQAMKKKEALTVYKAITRSNINYACGVWTPNVANSHWQKLEARQNDALRCATGCLRMTGIDHLRNETQCIPIKDH